MERVLVMFGVARPEVMVVVPAQEGVNTEEKPVEPAGPEDGIVDQFVKTVDQECQKCPLMKTSRAVTYQGQLREEYTAAPADTPRTAR